MIRSLWSGVTGIKTHQTQMDVIGNNIANVNTTSYKSQAAGFQDILYQTTHESFAATDNRGSVNAQQVGLGAKMSSITTNITAMGSAVTTDNAMDLMINGDAFFMINKDGTSAYSRDGSFTVDMNGYLSTSADGFLVQGVMGDETISESSKIENLKVIDRSKELVIGKDADGNDITRMADLMEGQATTDGFIRGILDYGDAAFDESGLEAGFTVYGTDGKMYTLNFLIDNAGDTNDSTYNLSLSSVQDEDGNYLDYSMTALNIVFDSSNGDIKTVTNGNDTVTYERNESDKLIADKDLNLTFTGEDVKVGTIKLDLAYLNNYGSRIGKHISTISSARGDVTGAGAGYPQGELNGISFREDGSIIGLYSNGQQQKKGQIALVNFNNAMGLEKMGKNLYSVSPNSGEPLLVDPAKEKVSIMTGVLEGSNVDLAKEFTDMITTQRGFQANSKVITTSDEILQNIRDLKR